MNLSLKFLKELASRRKLFLKGLDDNKGDINLDIFGDFYPDQAHFIFELLQNAEDADATKATFTLTRDGCYFEHNGTRRFTKDDVKSITGIHSSTKTEVPDQIGKFGIGFKSVFVYTSTPTVYPGDFPFKIIRFICPEPLTPNKTTDTNTRFYLPFNHPKKTPDEAYTEIKHGLNELTETTLLFLNSLESIQWQVDQTNSGEVRCIQHSSNHFEVRKQIDGKNGAKGFHFLKFDRLVEGLNKQRVAIAYELEFLPNVRSFNSKKPLEKQLKIVPSSPGRVAVFFPAKKETSGLRFHLHAPFVPELSRASIKDTPANEPLFQQLAELVADSLHDIHSLGLLSANFLGVLPNANDTIPDRYSEIRSAIVKEMKTQSLTPTHTGSHAPAQHLHQAKASLKNLLSEEDIEFLIDYDDEPPQWAIGATQKNSNVDRFLTQLEIIDWDIEQFVELIREKTGLHSWQEPDDEFSGWLAGKSIDWHQQFYALLYKELGPGKQLYRLKGARIVRLNNGDYSAGDKCFFPGKDIENDETLPRVDANVYSFGKKNKGQKEDARKSLEELGVREVGEAEQVEAILKQRYTKEAEIPDEKTYRKDLKRFSTLVEKEHDKASLFNEYFVFHCKDNKWRQPSEVFLDAPFHNTGLTAYFEVLGEEATCFSLADSYQDCGISVNSLAKFAKAIGVQTRLLVHKQSVFKHPRKLDLISDSYYARITYTKIDEDWYIANLPVILKAPSVAIAKLVWDTIQSVAPRELMARYRPNQQHPLKNTPSTLVLVLQEFSWVPQGGELFLRPPEASRELLPEGFPFDSGWPWLKAIRFGEKVAKKSEDYRQKQAMAKELGFPDKKSLEAGQWFAALPPEQQKKIQDDNERRQQIEMPNHEPPNNPERRAERIREEAIKAPERRTEVRNRSVSIHRDLVKGKAAQYLREQYTNNDGEMICQVCKGRLPFHLDDGTIYFEKIEFLRELKKHHYQNYLALCPNHAAMFQYANGSLELMQKGFVDLTENQLMVVLARKKKSIYFTGKHIADLKKVIESESQQVQYEDDKIDKNL